MEGVPNLEDNKKKIDDLVQRIEGLHLFDAGMEDLVVHWPNLSEDLTNLSEMRIRQVIEHMEGTIRRHELAEAAYKQTDLLLMGDLKEYLRYVLNEDFENSKKSK